MAATSPRRKIPKHLRVQILARDGYRCLMCGRRPPDVTLHIDHVVALTNGGADELGNYATLCDDCNIGKSAYRFRDYRDIHVRPAPIPLDRASLFAYVNAHTRPRSIAERIAAKRQFERRPFEGDGAWLMEMIERLQIATVLDLDEMVSRHAAATEAVSDYLRPQQAIDVGFVLARVLEIEAMERNGLKGLDALLSDLKLTAAGPGWRRELFHAYEQVSAARAVREREYGGR
jgi:hypothetical protein